MRLILPALLILAAIAIRIRRDARKWAEPDPMAQPFLDSRNSATYLYNARTGVITSYN
jgi:hypothetical protein